MDLPPDRSTESESQTPARVPQGGKLTRIAAHTQGLVEDLREWIDLRIDLALLEVEDQVNEAANQAKLGAVLAVLGFFTGLFALTTAALGLGWLLGHPFWGFLIVFAVLALTTLSLAQAKPQLGGRITLFDRLGREDASAEPDAGRDADRPAREAKATVQNGEKKASPKASTS